LLRTEPSYLRWQYVAFMARTFWFHAGLVFLGCAVAALLLRRSRLALATVPLLVVALGPVVPQYLRWPAGDGVPRDLRVMNVNLFAGNRQRERLIDEIQAADADVLILIECTSGWRARLWEALGAEYPHTLFAPRDSAFGLAVFSRLPFIDEPDTITRVGGRVPEFRFVVDCKGRRVACRAVHILPPNLAFLPARHAQSADVYQDVRDDLTDAGLPLVVAGDFNWTERSAMHRRFRALGLTDAHEAAGFGLGDTWPVAGWLRYVPGVRIDHVYVGNGVRVVGCRTGTGAGSDHRPVVVDLALDAKH